MEKNANNTKARIDELLAEIRTYEHAINDVSEALDSANDELTSIIEDNMAEEA